jgi:hypothetical protein
MPSISNVTVPPLATPVPGDWALTVVVNVTGCPWTTGFTEGTRTVAVLACVTWWSGDRVPLLLAIELLALKVAFTVCEPSVSVVVVKVATPELLTFTVPAGGAVPSISNVTVDPANDPPDVAGVTVAVNVTGCDTTVDVNDCVTVVVLVVCTFCVSVALVLPAKVLSPL